MSRVVALVLGFECIGVEVVKRDSTSARSGTECRHHAVKKLDAWAIFVTSTAHAV